MDIFQLLCSGGPIPAPAMIPEEKIQEILQATDIVALIESYFPLKRAGTNFRAVCPFHNEKTPSFNVNPQRQIFKCFGCGAGGNAIAFVRDYEGLTFPDAVTKVGKMCGIEVVQDQPDPKAAARQRARSRLITLHNQATDWFHENLLKSPDAKGARAYLKGRGIGGEIAKNWQMGYAPADGSQFLSWAKSQGFSAEVLMQSGLAALKDENFPARGLYTRFRDRVMFPIVNDFGDVVAFSGRILDAESKLAKYMNSPETPLFLKSKTLFGFHKSRKPIMKAKKAIVCEGQLDLITCFEFGVENVVAPLGTAFTRDHARVMARYAEEVILCFDSDAAGYKAAERSFGELASEEKLIVRVVEMPEGLDPDTLIRTAGIESFQQRIDTAKHFWDFQIDHLSASMDLDSPRDRIQFANILATTVAKVTDKVVQDGIIHTVATRLRIPADDFRGRVAVAAKRHRVQEGRTAAYSKGQGAEEDPAQAPIQIDNTDIVVLCKLALTDADTRAWLNSERARIDSIRQLMEVDVLVRLWGADYDASSPTAVSAFLSSLPSREESFCTELLIKKTPGSGLNDAMRSLLRLEIKEVENRMEVAKGKLRSAGLADSVMTQTINAVMLLKKELVEKQKSLRNIA